MWIKLSLAVLLVVSLAAAIHFRPDVARTPLGVQSNADDRRPLRLMTWNVGYAALEEDTRAHTEDMAAVADVIAKNDPDAVALQELAGEEQLNILLSLLGGRYRGFAGRLNRGDRVEAVLVKDPRARFDGIQTRRADAASVTFNLGSGELAPEVVFVSAHADAFNAVRRRRYTEAIVEWAAARLARGRVVLVAGDFNFELSSVQETRLFTDNLKHDSEAYSYLLAHFRDLGREAGDTAMNERRIDYIFGPRDGAELVRAEVLRGSAVGRMDHWPLVVQVELKEQN
jgi:endonuclease/exonuclease/phosphatase family metal-dependent hydrolase